MYANNRYLLDEIQIEFNLNSSNIVTSVTDIGSNLNKTFKEFGVPILDLDSIDLENELIKKIDQNKLLTQVTFNSRAILCYCRCKYNT